MDVRRLAGIVALVSGALFVVLWVVGAFAASPALTVGGPMRPMMDMPHMGGPGMMGGWTGTSAGGTAPIAGARDVRVTAADLSFAPSEIRLPASAVNLTLTNTGSVVHDLTIPALGVRVVAAPGETRTIGLRNLPVGQYGAYCSVPGHAEAGMRALVIVE